MRGWRVILRALHFQDGEPPHRCKCWADAHLPNGEPSGESCNRISTTEVGLCKGCHQDIVPPDRVLVAAS